MKARFQIKIWQFANISCVMFGIKASLHVMLNSIDKKTKKSGKKALK